jgi:hypothetical protein
MQARQLRRLAADMIGFRSLLHELLNLIHDIWVRLDRASPQIVLVEALLSERIRRTVVPVRVVIMIEANRDDDAGADRCQRHGRPPHQNVIPISKSGRFMFVAFSLGERV